MMHGHEKSRSAIVAVKPTNKAERSAAESVERRAETKGNVDQQRTRRTQRRISVLQMLARIRQHIVAVEQSRSTCAPFEIGAAMLFPLGQTIMPLHTPRATQDRSLSRWWKLELRL
jgi:hypothetical protein